MQEVRARPATTAREAFGSRVAEVPSVIVLILVPLIIMFETFMMIALPLGAGNVLLNLMFWVLIFMVGLPSIAQFMFAMGLCLGNAGAMIGAIIFYIVGLGWQLFAMIWFIIVLITCDGDASCADNMDCMGTIVGPYDGPTGRFLGLFILSILGVIAYLIAAIVAFFDMRKIKSHTAHWQRMRIDTTRAAEEEEVGTAWTGAEVGCRYPLREEDRYPRKYKWVPQ